MPDNIRGNLCLPDHKRRWGLEESVQMMMMQRIDDGNSLFIDLVKGKKLAPCFTLIEIYA